MKATELVLKSLEEDGQYIADAVKGLTASELAWSPVPHSNSIIFLIWHLARIEDLWINRVLKSGNELYESENWYKKIGTPPEDNGFGYDVDKLKLWRPPALALLQEYTSAVRKTTVKYLKTLTEKQLEETKDFGWRKGTVGWALTHLVSEVGQHSGQIGYIRGIIKGIEPLPPPPPPQK
jgi:uncharacterized damage-inducible protein DinB